MTTAKIMGQILKVKKSKLTTIATIATTIISGQRKIINQKVTLKINRNNQTAITKPVMIKNKKNISIVIL